MALVSLVLSILPSQLANISSTDTDATEGAVGQETASLTNTGIG